jgi:plastocyanin
VRGRRFGDSAVTVQATDALRFTPSEVRVQIGDTVRWENQSTVVHTVTADPDRAADAANVELPDGAAPFDSGFVDPGDSFTHTFDTPGTYRYVCIPHEGVGMIGTIVVEE